MSCQCCGLSAKFMLPLASILAVAIIAGSSSLRNQQETKLPTAGKNEPAKTGGATESKQTASEGSVTASDEGTGNMATFGGGCFWCVEAVFLELKGVESVKSGYMGGTVENPTYQQVCNGTTGHAEVIQIVYDPKVIGFEKLLEVFFVTHDPTTLNRQGNDYGTQYRSAVFYHDEDQRASAEAIKARLDEADIYSDPIVTEITAASTFYPAEDYHQNYFARNPNQPYCQAMIPSKLKKVHKVFADYVK
jgi:peptide-methionine (S)-S-oxide reductase